MTDDTNPAPRDPLEVRALDALRAADPIPDDDPAALAAARAVTLARIAREPLGDEFPRSASAPTRRRRSWSWPRVAVAASVAAIGVGLVGLAVGRATAPQPAATVVAGSDAEALGGGGAPPGPAVATEAALGADAAKSSMIGGWYGGSTVVEPGPAVPDEPGTAAGYRFASDGTDPADLARAVAGVFGVDGDVREQDGMWMAGSADWTGPTVTVTSYGSMLTWSYSDPTVVPCVVAQPEPAVEEGAASTPGSAPDACEPVGDPAPSAAEAEALARGLLADLGVDGEGLRWESYADGATASASAALLLDGASTPISHWFSFGPGGAVQSASGTSAEVVAVPDYPVLGARSAILRAQQPGWGGLLAPRDGVVALAAEGARGVASSDATVASAEAAPPPPAPELDGRPVAQVPMTRLIARSATPTVVAWYQPDGTTLMVPGYALAADDGTTWTVIAVAEPYVQPLGG
jgi:hypothetical protein